MKKVERINIIMRYINNRAHFTISEIMREFNISRSTAIRDIREIEAMGMPLVAEVGRDGGYFVMNNSVLPTVRFTDNEIKALIIAFMATKNQQLPYLKSRHSLAEKLLGLISESQQDDLVLLNQVLLFEGTNPHNPDLLDLSDLPHPMLEQLIQIILADRYLLLSTEEAEVKSYPIYLLHLYREKTHGKLKALISNSTRGALFQSTFSQMSNPIRGKKNPSKEDCRAIKQTGRSHQPCLRTRANGDCAVQKIPSLKNFNGIHQPFSNDGNFKNVHQCSASG